MVLMATPIFSFNKENKDYGGAGYIGEVQKDSGPIFYPASYSTSIENEPYYSTQNTYTFDSMSYLATPTFYRGDSVKVAIIDSGLNYEHEDFIINNNQIIQPTSRTIDNTSGQWLFYQFEADPDKGYGGYPTKIRDTLGHGTNVASVIASQINSVGCAGIAPNVDLYIYKVTNTDNGYEWTAINSALQYCIDEGIDVINMSFQAYEHAVSYNGSSMGASTGCSTVMTSLLNQCYNAGITLVAAAGNFNTSEPSYPASNNHVISVGSLAESSTTTKAGYSNTYGIDLVAPGTVYVADKGNTNAYKKTQGTSFSAPIVTAAIALYKQQNPYATPSQIESALYASCDSIAGNPSWAGHGRLNIDEFLGVSSYTPTQINWTNVTNNELEIEVGKQFQLECEVLPSYATNKDVHYQIYDGDSVSVTDGGLVTALKEGTTIVEVYSDELNTISNVVEITVVPSTAVTLTSIEVKTAPTKLTYIEGNKFDPTGLVITANYSDSSKEDVDYATHSGEFSFTPSLNTSLTTSTISVSISYGGCSTNQAIAVNAKSLTSISVSNPKTAYYVGDSFTKPTVTAHFDNGTSSTVTNSATFSGYNLSNSGNQTVVVSYTYGGVNKTTSYDIVVTAVTPVSISISGQKTSFTVGDSFSFGGTVTATNNNGSHTNVTNLSSFTGYNMNVAGNYTVTVSYSNLSTTYQITVNPSYSYNLVTSNSMLVTGDKVVIKDENGYGVTGWNNNKDANVATSNWKEYEVTVNENGFKLYDSVAKKYVASPSGNEFKYDTTGGDCSVNSSGHLYCNSRVLCANGTNYRFYSSLGSYVPFFVYKVSSTTVAIDSISIKTAPTKTSYVTGECFDPTGLVLTVTYKGGSSDEISYANHQGDFSFNPGLSTQLTTSNTSVTITYGDKTVNQTIAVKELSSLSISGYQTSFVEGDEFVFGGIVNAVYSDSSYTDVTSSASFSGYDLTVLGEQTVTVSYGNKSTQYTISVNQGTLSSITLSGYQTEFFKGEVFEFDGTCTAHFANGYQKSVTPTSISSPNMSIAGNKTVTVSLTYNGVTKEAQYQITVVNQRTVIETSESIEYQVLGTITYSGSSEVNSNSAVLSTSRSGYTEISSSQIRLGSGSNTGTITITSTSANITKVVVHAKAYSGDSNVKLSIGGTNSTITSSYANYTKEFTTATNSVEIKTTANSKRAYIDSITVYKTGSVIIENDISTSDDCVGLEAFITNYLHMDYVESLGYCNDEEHHYYSSARDAFNLLNDHQRLLFVSNVAYSIEWERISTWASFNQEHLNSNNKLVANTPNLLNADREAKSGDNYLLIVIIGISISAISIFAIMKRKKD